MKNIYAALEALLFIYGEPIAVKKIAQILNKKPSEIEQAAQTLKNALHDETRGLALIRHKDQLQLVTRPEFAPLLEMVMKTELRESLTHAAVETLAIISYGAPIIRSEIDYIRGVNSSFILRSLLLRGLIERSTDAKRGNAYVYEPSADFLKYLGVSQVEDLPEYEKFAALAKKVKPEEERDGGEKAKASEAVAPQKDTITQSEAADAEGSEFDGSPEIS
jgi:segregation and condensation protein B